MTGLSDGRKSLSVCLSVCAHSCASASLCVYLCMCASYTWYLERIPPTRHKPNQNPIIPCSSCVCAYHSTYESSFPCNIRFFSRLFSGRKVNRTGRFTDGFTLGFLYSMLNSRFLNLSVLQYDLSLAYAYNLCLLLCLLQCR